MTACAPDAAFRHSIDPVQTGGRSIRVTVTDRGPFTGAFLDLSPGGLRGALGCRCTHRNVTATIVQMGSRGGTLVAKVEAVNVPSALASTVPLFQPTGDVMRPLQEGCSGSTVWPWLPLRTNAGTTVVVTSAAPVLSVVEGLGFNSPHPNAKTFGRKIRLKGDDVIVQDFMPAIAARRQGGSFSAPTLIRNLPDLHLIRRGVLTPAGSCGRSPTGWRLQPQGHFQRCEISSASRPISIVKAESTAQ